MSASGTQQPDRQAHFWPLHSCTRLQWGGGGNRLNVGLHLIYAMLDHDFFLRTCNGGIAHEDCRLSCGNHVSTPPGPPIFFRKQTFTQARQLGPVACVVCSLLSHTFGEGDCLVNELIVDVSARISLEYQIISGWWQLIEVPQEDHREISK